MYAMLTYKEDKPVDGDVDILEWLERLLLRDDLVEFQSMVCDKHYLVDIGPIEANYLSILALKDQD